MAPVKVLMVHNYYQMRGGEDAVFEMESKLLEERGHEVIRITEHNDRIRGMSALSVAAGAFRSCASERRIDEAIRAHRPGLAHFHNTFPLISPGAYAACRAQRVPIVQTLHNFRIMCPAGTFLRNGADCFDCLGKPLALPGILHACYRHSRAQSALSASVHAWHRAAGTYAGMVDAFIALSEHSRELFVRGGLPREKIHVRPNGIPDHGAGDHAGGYALFCGRLSEEKGIMTVLEAFSASAHIPLKVVGDGPLRQRVEKRIAEIPQHNISVLGQVPNDELIRLMKGATLLVFASECLENCPLVLIEAMSTGLPITAARSPSVEELTGRGAGASYFPRGDVVSMRERISELWGNREMQDGFKRSSRETYVKNLSPEASGASLEAIYAKVISSNLPLPSRNAGAT